LLTNVSGFANTSQEKNDEELKKQIKMLMRLLLDEKIKGLRKLEKKYGSELVKKEVQFFIKKRTIKEWQRIANESKNNDVTTFVDILWNKLCKAEGIKFTINKKNSNNIKIHCTFCPAVARYKKLDALDWGYELYCKTDDYMVIGFNPKINFKRTKTLMQGDECCNHSYSIQK